MRRSIFRCADLIILSCTFDGVQVSLAFVNVGVITLLNKRFLKHRRHDLEVSFSRYLWNAAQDDPPFLAPQMFLLSDVSCTLTFVQYLILMLSIVTSFCLLEF